MKSKLQLAKEPYGPPVRKSWDHHVWILQMFYNTSGWRWVHLVQLRMHWYILVQLYKLVHLYILVLLYILVYCGRFGTLVCCVFTRFNYKPTGHQRWVMSATAMWLKLYQSFTHQLTAAECGEIASLQCIFQTIGEIAIHWHRFSNVAAVVQRFHLVRFSNWLDSQSQRVGWGTWLGFTHQLPAADGECIHKHAFMRIFTHQLGCMQSNAMSQLVNTLQPVIH